MGAKPTLYPERVWAPSDLRTQVLWPPIEARATNVGLMIYHDQANN